MAWQVLEEVHRLRVVVAASVVCEEVMVEARLEESVTLRCAGRGVPAPSLHWYKSVGRLTGQVGCGESCLVLARVSLASGGDYICSASNGVGLPAHATIHLTVLCRSHTGPPPPHITILHCSPAEAAEVRPHQAGGGARPDGAGVRGVRTAPTWPGVDPGPQHHQHLPEDQHPRLGGRGAGLETQPQHTPATGGRLRQLFLSGNQQSGQCEVARAHCQHPQ